MKLDQQIQTKKDELIQTKKDELIQFAMFLIGHDEKTIRHYLEKEYMYFIYIELVTPHNVSVMKITITDPDDKQYNIFESESVTNPSHPQSPFV